MEGKESELGLVVHLELKDEGTVTHYVTQSLKRTYHSH